MSQFLHRSLKGNVDPSWTMTDSHVTRLRFPSYQDQHCKILLKAVQVFEQHFQERHPSSCLSFFTNRYFCSLPGQPFQGTDKLCCGMLQAFSASTCFPSHADAYRRCSKRHEQSRTQWALPTCSLGKSEASCSGRDCQSAQILSLSRRNALAGTALVIAGLQGSQAKAIVIPPPGTCKMSLRFHFLGFSLLRFIHVRCI